MALLLLQSARPVQAETGQIIEIPFVQTDVEYPDAQMMLQELECKAEEDAIAEAFYQAELAAEAEEDAIADAFFLAELAAEAEEDAIADTLFKAEFDYQDAMVPF